MEQHLRVLIVDDEALSRERLRGLLSDMADVELVGECATGAAALTAIRNLEPDLVFLDVQMPGMDGFDLVGQLDPQDCPAIVFATAFDEYAVRAFEANAIDYLMKPISSTRLDGALRRVKERLVKQTGGREIDQRLNSLLEGLSGQGVYRSRFAVKIGNRHKIIRSEAVSWFEGADNYVRVHTGKESHLLRTTLAQVESWVDPTHFIRIHRSIIMNINHVISIEPWGPGEHMFVLEDGSKLISSRKYRTAIREIFGC